jgi:hypothetical protein
MVLLPLPFSLHVRPLSEVRAPLRASHLHELRKVMGGKLIDSSTAFLFEVSKRDSPFAGHRNFK